MAERKPPGVRFETWIDRQVREAMDRGEFDDLPGAGKPIADLGRPRDEQWWIKQKLRREEIGLLPPTLALRKEAENARRAAAEASTEAQARRILTEVNVRIREALIRPPAGPPLSLLPFDVERLAAQWRADHPAPTAADPARAGAVPPRGGSWWARRRRRR